MRALEPRGPTGLGALALIGALLGPSVPRLIADPGPDPAVQAIARAEDARRWADGELERYLGDPSPAVRARAALAVGRLQDSTSVAALLPLLGDGTREVRREAVFALGQIGHRSARAAIEARLDDPDPETIALAIEALGKLGDVAATPRVAAYLGHGSPALRGEAAVALWRLADSTALEALAARHADPDPEVRWRVLYALEKIVAPERIVLTAALHLEDREGQVRAQAARTLGRQRSRRGVAYLLQASRDPEVGVAVNALRALQLVADTTCTRCGGAMGTLLAHPHPYVRVTAATALGERFAWIGADSATRAAAVESLVARLADQDPATRGASARALVRHGGDAGLERARPLLGDSSVYVRVAVLQGLRGLPQGAAVPLLRARIGPQAPRFERIAALEALASYPGVETFQALREALQDTAVSVVATAASAIGESRDSTAVPALVRGIQARSGDPDPSAWNAIRDALRVLAGRPFADSLERLHPPPARPLAEPEDPGRPPDVKGALLRTTAGEIEWAFYAQEAPQTVRNFVRLAERGYFDGLVVHRVVPNFVIQDGDPTGTGWGGPGYSIRCEYNRLRYGPGMVGMALSGKDTGGSQWFITHSPQPHLDGRYTIFARVTRGMDVVGRIVQGDRVLGVEVLK